MTKRDVAAMAMKVTGLVLLVLLISELPLAVMQFIGTRIYAGREYAAYVGLTLCTTVVYYVLRAVVAVALIFGAERMAKRIVAEDGEVGDLFAGLAPPMILRLAMQVLGVILVAQAVPGVASSVTDALMKTSTAAGEGIGSSMLKQLIDLNMWSIDWPRLVSALVTLIIGAYLVSGATYLVNLLYGNARSEPAVDDAVLGG